MSTTEKQTITTPKPTEESLHQVEHKELHTGTQASGLKQVTLPQPPEPPKEQHFQEKKIEAFPQVSERQKEHIQTEKPQEHLPAAAITETGVGVPHVGPTLSDRKEPHFGGERAFKQETSAQNVVRPVTDYKKGDKEVNLHYIYNKHPTGDRFTEDVFRFEEIDFPRDPSQNEIVVRLTYISVDPFTRNRMTQKREFIQPFKLNDVLEGEATAEIIKSNNPKYQVGQNIVGFLKWTKYQIINFKNQPINIIPQDIDPSYFLSIFGMPGLTAYFGITEYAKLKPHNNVLVSGACGSVGLFVGQILRIKGCNRLFGLESSEEKIRQSLLFGYNECFNTHTQDIHQTLSTAFPEGIDVYWDNIGGSLLDIVIEHMRPHGRIILCGTLSECQPCEERHSTTLTKFDRIIAKSITIQGLFYPEFSDRFSKAYKQLLHWYHEGKIKTKETTLEGFNHIPEAFNSLLKGETIGKTLVRVEPKPALVA